jgi:serine/threonine protein kinase/WD40 repeat protein
MTTRDEGPGPDGVAPEGPAPSGDGTDRPLPPTAGTTLPMPPLEPGDPAWFGKPPGKPPSDPAASDFRGDFVGPYKLLAIIGEGGFGTVYLAERREPIVQRVALKIIKLGMDTKAVIARFEQERQALAVMDHPFIAKVFDAGATSAGRPYFVMEHVAGEPVTEYADRHNLSVGQRLELFAGVCEAVQHAHLKGIIHRDLKPSNILVSVRDGKAAPKVIDFGVAKAITHTLTDKTIFTETGQLIGTPEYMSPEQAEMGATDIDTRTDVYSLGVVLYELLTGLLPFDARSLRSAGHAAIVKVLREQDAPKPSTRLSTADAASGADIARHRGVQREHLATELRRELDWIPLKALRKDRTQRYQSPADLARDMRNYLEGKPLEAGPEATSYRVKKYIRRNKGPVAAAAAVFVALVLGLSGTLWGLDKARIQADRERTARIESEANADEARIAGASALLQAGTVDGMAKLLRECDPSRRGWEWSYLNSQIPTPFANSILPESLALFGPLQFRTDGRALLLMTRTSVLTLSTEDSRRGEVLNSWSLFADEVGSPGTPSPLLFGMSRCGKYALGYDVRAVDGDRTSTILLYRRGADPRYLPRPNGANLPLGAAFNSSSTLAAITFSADRLSTLVSIIQCDTGKVLLEMPGSPVGWLDEDRLLVSSSIESTEFRNTVISVRTGSPSPLLDKNGVEILIGPGAIISNSGSRVLDDHKLIDVDTGEITNLPREVASKNWTSAASSNVEPALSADGTVIAWAQGQRVAIYSVLSGHLHHLPIGFEPSNLALSPDGRRLAVDTRVLIDVASLSPTDFSAHALIGVDRVWGADSSRAVAIVGMTLDRSKPLLSLDLRDGSLATISKGTLIAMADMSPDGSTFITRLGTLRRKGGPEDALGFNGLSEASRLAPFQRFRLSPFELLSVVGSEALSPVLTNAGRDFISVLDSTGWQFSTVVVNGRRRFEVVEPLGNVSDVLFEAEDLGSVLARAATSRSGDRHVLAYGAHLHLWSGQPKETGRQMSWPERELAALEFSPDGSLIACVSRSGEVALLDWESGELLTSPQRLGGPPGSLAFTPDGSRLLASAPSGAIHVWGTADARHVLVVPMDKPVLHIGFPDSENQSAVIVRSDGSVRRLLVRTAHP